MQVENSSTFATATFELPETINPKQFVHEFLSAVETAVFEAQIAPDPNNLRNEPVGTETFAFWVEP
jgi:hypothetical protein